MGRARKRVSLWTVKIHPSGTLRAHHSSIWIHKFLFYSSGELLGNKPAWLRRADAFGLGSTRKNGNLGLPRLSINIPISLATSTKLHDCIRGKIRSKESTQTSETWGGGDVGKKKRVIDRFESVPLPPNPTRSSLLDCGYIKALDSLREFGLEEPQRTGA